MNIKEWRRIKAERERLTAALECLPSPKEEVFEELLLEASNGHCLTLRAGLCKTDYGNGPVAPDFHVRGNDDFSYGEGVAPELSQEVLLWLLDKREHFDRWLQGEEESPLPPQGAEE